MNMPAGSLEDLAGRMRPRTASNLLLYLIVAFFVAAFAWAALTELDRTVRAPGRVIPSSQLQIVSNLEGGIVEEIMVAAGDVVRAGAALLRLDPTQTSSEFGSGEASVAALRAKIARLSAEVQGIAPVYPLMSGAAGAEQVRIERALHRSRMAELGSLQLAGEARVAQAARQVAEAEAAHQARLSERSMRRSERDILRPLVERGIEPRLSLVQAENAFAVAESEAAAAAATIGRARAAVAEARAASAQQRQDWLATAAAELAVAQAELSARRQAIPALAEAVERTVVRAPLAGRINRVLVTTVGGTVQPGQPLVEIVPSEESLLVEALVRPQDIAAVHMGQEARVNITAYDPAVYGNLRGKVIGISPDAILDERTGESHYTVRVRTARDALVGPAGRPLPIGVGMTADVSLLADKRTILQYILTPITRLNETAFRE